MWIYVPSANSPSVPEEPALILASDWRCLALSRSVMWRSKPIPSEGWLRVWKKVPWVRHLFGQMCEPSTASRGVEQWISSWADTPASPSASPGSSAAPTTPDTYGPASPGSSMSVDLESASLKTWATTFGLDTSQLSSPTSNALATESRRRSSRRRKLARPTSATASSSWPTANHPEASDSLTGKAASWPTPTDDDANNAYGRTGNQDPMQSLARDATNWPTPNALNFNDGEDPTIRRARLERLRERHNNGNGAGEPLAVAAQNWPTPDTQNARDGAFRRREAEESPDGSHHAISLHHAADLWQTPVAEEARSSGGARSRREGRQAMLHDQARTWRLIANDYKGTAKEGQRRGQLDEAAEQLFQLSPSTSSHLDPERPTPGQPSSESDPSLPQLSAGSMSPRLRSAIEDFRSWAHHAQTKGWGGRTPRSFERRSLSPVFVAWLMGWPLFWIMPEHFGSTLSTSQEMASYRSRLRMRLRSLLAASAGM